MINIVLADETESESDEIRREQHKSNEPSFLVFAGKFKQSVFILLMPFMLV